MQHGDDCIEITALTENVLLFQYLYQYDLDDSAANSKTFLLNTRQEKRNFCTMKSKCTYVCYGDLSEYLGRRNLLQLLSMVKHKMHASTEKWLSHRLTVGIRVPASWSWFGVLTCTFKASSYNVYARLRVEGSVYLTMNPIHLWLYGKGSTREETCCRHFMVYSFRVATMDLLYAPYRR